MIIIDFITITFGDYSSMSHYDDLRALEIPSRSIDTTLLRVLEDLPAGDTRRNTHPLYQVIYNKDSLDIIKNYHENRNIILYLPTPPLQIAEISITEIALSQK